MAATTPPMIGGSDPSVLKSLEKQSPSIAKTSPATISATTGAATSSGSSVARGIIPIVTENTVIYNQATQTTSGNSVAVTSSSSNDPGDVVTVYTSPKAVSVSSVNQTINTYKVNNYEGNEYSNNDVANYLPTYTGTISAGNLNVTGSTDLGPVGNVTITGGTSGQVLTTNGSNVLSWTTVSGGNSSYGNSNVANYLPTFTGNIGGNVITANLFSGNGSSLTNIPGANVSGAVANATYAVTAGTANSVAGANVSGAVSFATTANSVALANVSGAGNIANINLDGSSSNVLYGNGVWSAASTANTGNVTFNDINIIGTGNLKLQPDSTNASAYVDIFLTAGPDIHLAGNGANIILGTDSGANVSADTSGNVTIQASNGSAKTWTFDTSGNLNTAGDLIGPAGANFTIYSNAAVHEFVFGDDGTFYAPDNVVLGGSRISIGPGANDLADLNNAVFIASTTGEAYIQGVIENVSDNGSADWVALGHRGDDTGGWADLGFTSSGFNDANYTITGPGDGYVFAETFAPGTIITGDTGGNLVLATGSQGTVNDIIFGTGGFLTTNVFGRISDANNSLELSRTGASLTFPDGSIQTTAYTGGGGGGNTGNVTFSNVTVQGDNNALNLSAGADFTANLAYLQIRAGDVASHIHLETGNATAYDLIVGDDQKFVQVSSTGNIIMSSYDGNTSYTMTLDTTGNLTTPSNLVIGPTGIGTGTAIAQTDAPLQIASTDANGSASIGWYGNPTGPGNVVQVALNQTGGSMTVTTGDYANTTYVWDFDNTGSLQLPTISLGSGVDEQTVVQSQRKIIPGLRYSAEINGTTPTVVYTAASIDTTSMKVTMQIQHVGLGMEFFEVYATQTGGDTYYSVSNRLQPPTISNSTVVVDLNGSNIMEITVTINSGAANSWVTYDATEFGIAVD